MKSCFIFRIIRFSSRTLWDTVPAHSQQQFKHYSNVFVQIVIWKYLEDKHQQFVLQQATWTIKAHRACMQVAKCTVHIHKLFQVVCILRFTISKKKILTSLRGKNFYYGSCRWPFGIIHQRLTVTNVVGIKSREKPKSHGCAGVQR